MPWTWSKSRSAQCCGHHFLSERKWQRRCRVNSFACVDWSIGVSRWHGVVEVPIDLKRKHYPRTSKVLRSQDSPFSRCRNYSSFCPLDSRLRETLQGRLAMDISRGRLDSHSWLSVLVNSQLRNSMSLLRSEFLSCELLGSYLHPTQKLQIYNCFILSSSISMPTTWGRNMESHDLTTEYCCFTFVPGFY